MSAPIDSAAPEAGAPGPAGAGADLLAALRRERLAANLVALLGTDDPSIADDLLALGEWTTVSGGEPLFRQGEPGDSMFLVVSGALVAVREDPAHRQRPRVVGRIRAGECVGEMGLIASQPRTATVVASRDSAVVRISERAFQQVVATHPRLVTGAARLVIRRTTELMGGQAAPVERARTVAVIPLRPGVDGIEFVERLQRALERRGPTLVIDRARADAALTSRGVTPRSGEDARDLVLSTWLDEQELRHEAVLLRADRVGDPWTERCVHQADVVLLLAPSGASPEVDEAERRLSPGDGESFGARRELVLLHPAGAGLPAGTARWLAPRRVARHHHVRREREDDVRRLARFLTGDAVGLVLGGGGARGFAHLGVIRALREEGIPIDAVGGTSQGAIAAATVAMDWDDATIHRVHREGFTVRNPVGDWALVPHLALVKGKRLDAALERCFGAVQIEDAWRSFFCVSANLTLAEPAIHRRGLLWRALRASVSLPGILPPVVLGEHLHVDGSLLDNLPVEPMRASGAGRIIAVDLSVRNEAARLSRGELPSLVEILKERLRSDGTEPRAPGLATILVRSAMMSSTQRARELQPGVELHLAPEPAEIGFLDWKALDRGIELGYRFARRELARRDLGSWRDPRP